MAGDARSAFDAAVDRVCAAEGWKREGDEIRVDTVEGRSQRVLLDAFEFEGEPLVRVCSAIGPTVEIEPLHLNHALRLNYGLPYGALALRDDELVILDTMTADDPDDDEIASVVGYLAELADRFERTIFGPDEG